MSNAEAICAGNRRFTVKRSRTPEQFRSEGLMNYAAMLEASDVVCEYICRPASGRGHKSYFIREFANGSRRIAMEL